MYFIYFYWMDAITNTNVSKKKKECLYGDEQNNMRFDPHLSNLCIVRARVLLSSSMIRLWGWRGSTPYCTEWPPIGAWLWGWHLWKASEDGSTLPAGMAIMSFFGGRGGDSFADLHGNFTGAPSARRRRRRKSTEIRRVYKELHKFL